MVYAIGAVLEDPGLMDLLVFEIAETYARDRCAYNENAPAYTLIYAREVRLTAETAKTFMEMCKELDQTGERKLHDFV